jgi:gliding motility-associated-like protein
LNLKKHITFFCCFFLLLNQHGYSTHIVGGEMNYKSLGNGDYEITLIVYRDCYNGQAPFDDPASIGVFDSNNNLVTSFEMYLNNPIENIPNVINSPCLIPPTNVCYEVARYTEVVNLPPIAGGYQLAYQRCCRNHTIINIQNPGAVGATITAVIPDPSLVAFDANPVFNNLPPNFVCLDAPFIFDHSATDADGDVLVYELCAPYTGASQSDPMPNVPSPPPYATVPFQSPYSLANVMGGVPMTINSSTGLIHAVPATEGQFVYGIRVKEYRNGIYIGETRREFQVNVQQCGTITIAGIFSPTIACGTPTASFLNLSYGAGSYYWNFGDPLSGSNDTSSLVLPNHIYSDTGTYQVELVAFSSIDPACNDTDFGTVYVYPEFNTIFSFNNNHCSSAFQFNDLSYGADGTADYWYWNFGDGQTSGAQSPGHLYTNPGTYNVTLIASTDSGCTDTISKIIHVLPVPVSQFSVTLDSCARTIHINNASTPSNYYWNFGDGGTAFGTTGAYTYNNSGNFTIQLIAQSDSGCTDTSQTAVQIPLVPLADFTFSSAPCDSVVHFTNLSVNSTIFTWDFGDFSYAYNTDPGHLYHDNGPYTITLHASGTGLTCSNDVQKVITLDRTPIANFATLLDTCAYKLALENQTQFATQYSWLISDGNISSDDNPSHDFSQPGNYSIQLIASTASGCADTISSAVNVPPKAKADYSIVHTDCDSLVSFVNNSQNAVTYNWTFGDANTSSLENPDHTYYNPGDVQIQLVVASPHQCLDTITKDINLIFRIPADFSLFMDTCSSITYFNSRSPRATTYNWDFGDGHGSADINPFHVYHSTDRYEVLFITNKGTVCEERTSGPVKFEEREGEIISIPNTFTPNSDGKNDRFHIFSYRPCEMYSLNVFNRWGEQVYETDDALNTDWDGRYKGAFVEEGVYVYYLKGKTVNKTGYILVIK